ncbi:MAG: endonuclease/exonuclease/phosphatase family protein [Cyclobacteriaceae bacterium]
MICQKNDMFILDSINEKNQHLAKRIAQLILIVSGISYLSVYISPAKFWLAGFIGLAIPAVFFLNLLLLVYFGLRRSGLVLYPVVALVLGFGFWKNTFTWNGNETEAPDFSVLSYNVRVFNVYGHLNENFKSSRQIIRWVKENPAEIKCLQEFYNHSDSELFSTLNAIGDSQNYYHYFQKGSHDKFGIAIFSSYPIVNRGLLGADPRKFNHAIFIDVLVGKDTVRIYNMHLESMSIDEEALVNPNPDNLDKDLQSLVKKLKNGFKKRATQVDLLVQHIKECPYPVVLAGDMNDVPYSYSYRCLKKVLSNSFEQTGKGFGTSYNGKLPFLRIDNQFFSQALKAMNFETHTQVPYSDHFPITAEYKVKQD